MSTAIQKIVIQPIVNDNTLSNTSQLFASSKIWNAQKLGIVKSGYKTVKIWLGQKIYG